MAVYSVVPKDQLKLALKTLSSEQLITELQPRFYIWNHTHPEHFSRAQGQYVDLAKSLNSTVQIVKAKYQGLRTYWLKEYKKVLSSQRSGAGAGDTYQPSWPYYTSLMFLAATVHVNQTESSIEMPSEAPTDSASQADMNKSDSAVLAVPIASSPSLEEMNGDSAPETAVQPSRSLKRKRAESEETRAKTLKAITDTMMTVQESRNPKLDEYDYAGKMIAEQLRQISNKQVASTTLLKIQQILHEARFQEQPPAPIYGQSTEADTDPSYLIL